MRISIFCFLIWVSLFSAAASFFILPALGGEPRLIDGKPVQVETDTTIEDAISHGLSFPDASQMDCFDTAMYSDSGKGELIAFSKSDYNGEALEISYKKANSADCIVHVSCSNLAIGTRASYWALIENTGDKKSRELCVQYLAKNPAANKKWGMCKSRRPVSCEK